MTDTTSTPTELWQRLLDPTNRADPYPLYDRLRETPVQQLDDGAFLVTGYDEVLQLAHDPRISSEPGRAQEVDGTAENGQEEGLSSAFVMLDPPKHDRLRRQTMRHFGPPHAAGYVDGLRTDIALVANELIDRLEGQTRIDLVESFAYPLPVIMICQVLGVPHEDEPRFHAWSQAIIAPPEATDPDDAADKQREAAEATRELAMYLGGLAEERNGDPRGDLLSGLVNAHGGDGPMSRGELINTAIMLLIGGHETTVNMIANGVLTMLRNPTAIDAILDEPETMPRTFEELLRFEPPAQVTPKYVALDDVAIGGTTITKGSPVWLAWAAANRDPRHFTDPNQFDPRREANDHVGFGAGIHACFGAPLARLETQIALGTFFDRVVDPRLEADPPPYRKNALLRGPSEIRLTIAGIRPSREADRERQ